MENPLLKQIENYVRRYCRETFPEDLLYHNLFHIEQVVDYVDEIARAEKLSDDEHEIASIAAWFHDIGIARDFVNHEKLSANIAEEYLTREHYPSNKIEKVKSAIMATRISNIPTTKLEYVLRDADSLHLGKLDFFVRMMALREEMRLRFDAEVTEQEILKASILFYRDHHYFTNYAREEYGSAKSANLNRLEQMYHKYFGDLPDSKSVMTKSVKKE